MKESEAKQKWCPFAQSRSVNIYDPKTNKKGISSFVDDEKEFPTPNCLGEKCMAWHEFGFCLLARKQNP